MVHRPVSPRALWLSFYFTVPLAFYDWVYCGVHLGYGIRFLAVFWYLTVFYIVPWVLLTATAMVLNAIAARQSEREVGYRIRSLNALNYSSVRIVLAGMAGGFVGNGVLGALFSSPPVRSILYDPRWQSRLFIEVTPQRDIPVSVAGLVILSVAHAWLFGVFSPSIPGQTWLRKGLFWGITIWLMYWVFQEWFIYHTLLAEPFILNALELAILLVGSLVEGVIISFLLGRGDRGATSAS